MVTESLREDRPDPVTSEVAEPGALRWWARTTIEVATLLALVVLAEATLSPKGIGSPGVHPHPYWLVVLPMASTRGMVAGLLAALLGTIVFSWAALSSGVVDGMAQLLSLEQMLEPVLMFAGAFLLGEIRDERESRIRERDEAQERAEQEALRLRRERDVLLEANRAIEARLVDHSVAFGNMIVAAARVEGADRDGVFEVALDLIEEHCGALASVLDVLHDQSVELLTERGWEPDRRDDRIEAARESVVVRQAIQQGRRVNAFAWNKPPERGPLLARPVLDAEHVVSAVICMDDVPPSRLNSRTVTTFFAICEWVEAVQGRLLAEAASKMVPSHAATIAGGFAEDIASPEDLGSRLRLEVSRHLEHGVPVSLLAIQFARQPRLGEERTDDTTLVRHLTSSRRASDGLYRFGFPGCYLLVLADTELDRAPVVARRMEERAAATGTLAEGELQISIFTPMEGLDDVTSMLEALTAHFREHSVAPLSAESPVPTDLRPRVHSLEEFGVRLEQECTLAARRSHPVHVVVIRLTRGRTLHDELLLPRMRDITRLLTATDVAAHLGENHAAVLIPHASEAEVGERVRELVECLRDRQAESDREELVIQTLALGETYPDAAAVYAALFQRAEPVAHVDTATDPESASPGTLAQPVARSVGSRREPPPEFPRF